ncbi:MAG: hypothetical protein RL743_1029, partial [Actinomycetota bacterium]
QHRNGGFSEQVDTTVEHRGKFALELEETKTGPSAFFESIQKIYVAGFGGGSARN